MFDCITLQTTDWVLICTSLFLGACALFVPLLAQLIERRYLAPNLIVEHRHEPPYSHKTAWRTNSDVAIEWPVYFFCFAILNNGKSHAKGVEAVINALWIHDASGNPVKQDNFLPVSLRFDETGRRSTDVSRRRRIFWNLGHISIPDYQRDYERSHFRDVSGSHANSLRFVFDLIDAPLAQPNCLVPGTYYVQIAVYSENAPEKEDVYLKIVWNGKWHDDKEAMLREIVISRERTPNSRCT
jgi:hypothetical protein